MKVGDYVRTKDGVIDKIIIEYNGHCASRNCNCKHVSCEKNYYDEDKIIKSSPNIIDLIEVHDVLKLFDKEYGLEYKAEVLLNEEGYKHISNYECSDLLNLEWELISGEHVKILSIVTKEQFSQMEYKIGE